MDGLILYNDSAMIAVNKPEGIPTVSGCSREGISLIDMLQSHTGEKLYIVHRLDKGASGAVVFAKTRAMHTYLNCLFAERLVQKYYLALAHGRVEPPSGVIDLPLRQFGSGRTGVDHEGGKPSVTKYETVKNFPHYTLLKVKIETGRRHQIRAHFYAIGHPLVGDTRYGDKNMQSRFPRLMLHSLSLELPMSDGTSRRIEAPLTESFNSFLEEAEKPV